MKTIQVKSCVSTDFDPVFSTIRTIEIEDQWIGRGGFGVAYRALSFDGKQTHPQIVKILLDTGNGAAQHGFATIRGLQDRLRRENQAMSGKLLQTLPSLQAVPQMSFEGILEGVPVVGYTSNDLTPGGFVEFGRILDDNAQLATLQKVPLSAKMRIALDLVAAFDFLKSKILFIHADIKAEALFLDLKGMHCAIIDFDGGALATSINDSPTTFGTPQDWLAPEIARQLTTPGRTGKIKVNLSSDAWSVNVAIHYILFGVSPFFFLSEVSDRSMDAFLKKHQWPECDPSFQYFAAGVAPGHKAYLAYLRSAVRLEIVEKLKVTINKGYRTPAQRIMYGSWKIVLSALTQPAIRDFTADPKVVEDGRKVHLTWDVTGAVKLELTQVGIVTNRTSADVSVTQDTVFELTLTADDGSQVRRSLQVTTDKRPPAISFFRASASLLSNALAPARLTWQVERAARIQIDQGVGDVTLQAHADVLPNCETRYTLTATSYFGVIATETVLIRVSTNPPQIVFFRSDAKLLEEGRPVTLAWEVSPDAYEVTISTVGGVTRTGTRVIDQRRATQYVLTATSYFGYSSSAMLDVQVSNAAPAIHEFSVTPSIVHYGCNAFMRWRVSGAERVWLDPESREMPPSGEEPIHSNETRRYSLRAVTWYGIQAERRANLTVVRRTKLESARRTRLDRSILTKLAGQR